MEVITIRIDEDNFKDLQEIEKQEKADRAAVTRKLLAYAIQEWKINNAIKLIQEGKITFRRAAKIIGCTYADFINLMEKRDMPIGYSLGDLKKDTN